mmetsp:Transcript_23627/g.33888  ORF Transcript_23627/g.33888 Transcript_23627/m.33888 type:complete len:186 (-) Transcript_23627:87-644(-)|eukprot:CAMPEP_0172414928 /NCGR_PEP_ID=MMETSP1064-20121228/1523_1 /TAXON_ID=202472 /ORGANISM="Aulacoseira subarctica , Strain CCAP 1002/5" /LENGTH=185 /DNA_ID=CAMNT_0013151805 /DNA_START=46 /DNA_END=603 /DNA_ORIENTATION=+
MVHKTMISAPFVSISFFLFAALGLPVGRIRTAQAFVPSTTTVSESVRSSSISSVTTSTTNRAWRPVATTPARKATALAERQWNFNSDGRNPWGVKRNAEVWNGRVAQMAFTVIVLQELITGKGVVAGLQEGNVVNIAIAGSFIASMIGLTVFLAIKANNYEEFAIPPPLGTQWKDRMEDDDDDYE